MQVKTGSKRVVVNVWSDAARRAAAEARRMSSEAHLAEDHSRQYPTASNLQAAAQAHHAAAAAHKAAGNHTIAAGHSEQHQKLLAKSKAGKGQASSESAGKLYPATRARDGKRVSAFDLPLTDR